MSRKDLNRNTVCNGIYCRRLSWALTKDGAIPRIGSRSFGKETALQIKQATFSKSRV